MRPRYLRPLQQYLDRHRKGGPGLDGGYLGDEPGIAVGAGIVVLGGQRGGKKSPQEEGPQGQVAAEGGETDRI